MSGGADSCDPDSDQKVVFVESVTDGMITVVQGTKVEDAAVFHRDAASAGSEAITNLTLSNIPCNSVAETSDSDTGLTAVTMMSIVRENDSSQASTNWLEKQNVIVCKLSHNGGRFSELNDFYCNILILLVTGIFQHYTICYKYLNYYYYNHFTALWILSGTIWVSWLPLPER